MKEKLKEALARHSKLYNKNKKLIPSAVLVPLFEKGGSHYILFTRRTHRVREHKGQISFPGGAREPHDRTLMETALRESREEIGLAAEAVELLGELDDMPTVGSEYVISPFVGLIPWPYSFKLDPFEVDEVIEVPVSWLLDRGNVRQEMDALRGERIRTFFYHYRGDVIWGASARILHQFLDIYRTVLPSGS